MLPQDYANLRIPLRRVPREQRNFSAIEGLDGDDLPELRIH